jgi:hypothetical protein
MFDHEGTALQLACLLALPSREQLLSQLQEWCKRAEESGIHALQEFAVRLRRYA